MNQATARALTASQPDGRLDSDADRSRAIRIDAAPDPSEHDRARHARPGFASSILGFCRQHLALAPLAVLGDPKKLPAIRGLSRADERALRGARREGTAALGRTDRAAK